MQFSWFARHVPLGAWFFRDAMFIAILVIGSTAQAQSTKSVDNGTDPTKMLRAVNTSYEHTTLKNGVTSGALRFNYTVPLGERQDYSLRLRLPVMTLDAPGVKSTGLGDASLTLTHVLSLSAQGGWVVQAEAQFDTARRAELGAGSNVAKLTLVRAFFLADGAIFAPAWVQSHSVEGGQNRASVKATTLDLYYVAKMKDPNHLLTIDPSLNIDWETNKKFVGLAVTYGRIIGKAFGGNSILSVKPTVFMGGDRPGTWGVEVGWKVIGF